MLATDHRADLFSLGVVLYEMATGHCPFLGQSTAEVISAILRDQPARDLRRERQDSAGDRRRSCAAASRRSRPSASARRSRSATPSPRSPAPSTSARPRSRVSQPPKAARSQIVKSRYARFGVAALAIIALGAGVFAWRARTPRRPPDAGRGCARAAPVAAQAPVARRPAAVELRERAGVLRRRHDRRPDLGPRPHPGRARHLAPVGDALQGLEEAPAGDRQGARRRLRRRRLRRPLGRPRAPERPGHPGRPRNHPLVRELRTRRRTRSSPSQNTFAAAIAGAVHVQISPVEETRMATHQAVDPEVYEAFLQGKLLGRQARRPRSLRKAQGYFERADRHDPTFAPAWVGLSERYRCSPLFHSTTADAAARGRSGAQRALALDPNLGRGARLARPTPSRRAGSWGEAEAAIQQAIELEPELRCGASQALAAARLQLRPTERRGAKSSSPEALDPLSRRNSAATRRPVSLRGSPRSGDRRAATQALELDPDYPLSHVYLFLAYSELKKDPERGLELRYYVSDLGRPELLPRVQRETRHPRLRQGAHLDRQSSWTPIRQPGRRHRLGVIAGLLAHGRRARRSRSPGSNAASNSAPGTWLPSRSPRLPQPPLAANSRALVKSRPTRDRACSSD